MMSSTYIDFQWIAVELVSGKPIAELPDLQVSKLSIRMEEITDCEAELPYDNRPVNWLDATAPFKIALLLVHDDVVLWGGIILKRERELGGSSVSLTMATVEHYLDSVYITTASYSQLPQTAIIQNLVGMTAGHRFPIDCIASASGIRRDRNYTADQDKTVLSAMQELSKVINGPEWLSYWRVNNDGESYTPVIVTADRIGSNPPVTTFDSTVLDSFKVLEDYSTGYGANRVQASSTAEGEVKPTSSWHSSKDESRPVVEYKYTPSTSIVNIPVLDQHAQQKLTELQDGTTTVSFSASLISAPELGIEWEVGDVVSYDVSDDEEQFPDFQSGSLRVIGYDLEFQGAWILTPALRPVNESGD